MQKQLAEMAAFVTEPARGIVYVHCKIGYSRSAAAIGAWLLATGQVPTVDAAMARLRKARPTIIVRPEIIDALQQFTAQLRCTD